jgi:hypothetical protein
MITQKKTTNNTKKRKRYTMTDTKEGTVLGQLTNALLKYHPLLIHGKSDDTDKKQMKNINKSLHYKKLFIYTSPLTVGADYRFMY